MKTSQQSAAVFAAIGFALYVVGGSLMMKFAACAADAIPAKHATTLAMCGATTLPPTQVDMESPNPTAMGLAMGSTSSSDRDPFGKAS